MARNYKRDARGRFARTNTRKPSKKYGRIGAVVGATMLAGGPAFMPAAGLVGFAAGRAIDNAVTDVRRRR